MSRQQIGAAIRARRLNKLTDRGRPLSQEKAAAAIGVSRATWQSWEAGDTLPDLEQAVRIAGLLDCLPSDLLSTELTADAVLEAQRESLRESGTREGDDGTARKRGGNRR